MDLGCVCHPPSPGLFCPKLGWEGKGKSGPSLLAVCPRLPMCSAFGPSLGRCSPRVGKAHELHVTPRNKDTSAWPAHGLHDSSVVPVVTRA